MVRSCETWCAEFPPLSFVILASFLRHSREGGNPEIKTPKHKVKKT